MAHLFDREARRHFLAPLLDAIREADVLTAHNLVRHDLPVLNADFMRCGLPPLEPVLVQDTMRLPRSKGFKKGQDNLGVLLRIPEEKLPLNYEEWQAAYSEPDLATVRERVVSDVVMHKQLREAMRERGWLSAPRLWRP